MILDTCIWLTNDGLLYQEEVAHQDFYQIWNCFLSRWIYNVDDSGHRTMQHSLVERPFDNFRVAITDPSHFFGRSNLLDTMLMSPFQVRILLAGRRLGKTSALRAVEWNLLNPNTSYQRRGFPVLINLQLEQPKDLDNLRYLLIARLREAVERWKEVPMAGILQMYREFLSRVKGGEVTLSFLKQLDIKFNINNPDHERRLNNDSFRLAFLKTIEELRRLNFDGVCFLIDGAEFIVRQNWATDAWSYLRGLKDTDTAIKPFLGLLLSGYRDLKEYQQRVGSPLLNIAEVEWLAPLSDEETKKLIGDRAELEQISLSEEKIAFIIEWSGCHPYLVQQTLNIIFDCHHQRESSANPIDRLLQHHDKDFSAWWNAEQHSGCFGETERTVYCTLVQKRKGNPRVIAQATGLSRAKVTDAIDVIAGTGVIRQLDDEDYAIGSRLFEEWVAQQSS